MNNKYLLPVAFAAVLAFGVIIGVKISPLRQADHLMPVRTPLTNVSTISSILSVNGMWTLNVDLLMDTFISNYLNDPETIDELFKQLDPHSSYIHKEDLTGFNEELDGNFDGIGIEFNIVDDTILVVAASSGGPSAKLGIQAGDKIIKIDDSLVAGQKLSVKK